MLLKSCLQVGVGVWYCMCEPDFVVWVLEFVLKLECVIIIGAFAMAIICLHPFVIVEVVWLFGACFVSGYFILKVLDFIASSLPELSMLRWVDWALVVRVGFLECVEWEDHRFHSYFVETVTFGKIEDTELDGGLLVSFVNNFVVEPLGVSFSVDIIIEP